MGRREESGGSETCGQDQFQLRLLPIPPRMSCVKMESPEQEEDSAFTNMMFTPSTTQFSTARVHAHTPTHTLVYNLSLVTSSLFMTVLYLHQNLTHHRVQGLSHRPGWMDGKNG